MTAEGLANLKKVMRKAIGLQVDATLIMATLQSIYCDEGDELSGDAEERLLSATHLVRMSMNYVIETPREIQKAYGIEKDLAELEDKLLNKQDNDTARTSEAKEARA